MSERKFEVDHSIQDVFYALVLNPAKMNYYGMCDRGVKGVNYRGGYENDTFCIYPFWWDDDNEEEVNKPNFIYKPTGFEIEWYKYPFRSAYMNQDLSRDELILIFAKCFESIMEDVRNG